MTVPDLPEPARPGASRTALAALQTHALLELGSPEGIGLAARLYASAAARGREHLATASDPAAHRRAVRAGELPAPEYLAAFGARKRWMTYAATGAIADGVRQIVVLGAGFDTLGLTLLHADAELLVVELDRPPMIEAKELALAAAKIARPWPRQVAVDLGDATALTGGLAAAGWRPSEPALFIAELALEYLEPRAAFAVLCLLGTICGSRGRIALTVRFGDVVDDRLAAVTAAAGEPMRFRPLRAELSGLLARAELEILVSRGRTLGRTGAAAFLLLAPSHAPRASETSA